MHAKQFLITSKFISQRFKVDITGDMGRAVFKRNEDGSPKASIHVTFTLVDVKMLLGIVLITGPTHSWVEK